MRKSEHVERRWTPGAHQESRAWAAIAVCAIVICESVVVVQAQPCSANPTDMVWIDLPQVDQTFGSEDYGNYAVAEMTFIDLLLDRGETDYIRTFYTTHGFVDAEDDDAVHPGRLRSCDLETPIPDLALLVPGGGALPAAQYILANDPVADWSEVLDGTPLQYGKRGSLNGMISRNGFLYVATPLSHDSMGNPPNFHLEWNGLSVLYGLAEWDEAFDPDKGELYSAGTAPLGSYLRQAVPEGVAITVTSPPFGFPSNEWLFVANYCGRDAGGTVLVQDINNPARVDVSKRYLIPCYELLADWLEFNPPPPGPLGHEVPRKFFTCPFDALGLPLCPDAPQSVAGNKIRAVLVVDVDPSVPHNGGRKLLFIVMNTDPVDIESYDDDPPYVPLDPSGRDDGKYDYVLVVDITNMFKTWPQVLPNPLPDVWEYKNPGEWASRGRFLRLPPDVPSGWTWQNQTPALQPGDDWSLVTVPNPSHEPGEPLTKDVRVEGSGTPKAIAVSSTGRYVYVLSSDQGQENLPEQGTADGGLHVPHLYQIDVGACDFTDQPAMNAYMDSIAVYRLPKVVEANFTEDPDPPKIGAVCVNPDPALNHPATSAGPIGPTILDPSLSEDDIGCYYPGEYQLDPTARTRMLCVRNDNLAQDQERLYIGMIGDRQTDTDNAAAWAGGVGAITVLSLDSAGVPTYLRTLTMEQDQGRTYKVESMEMLPNLTGWTLPDRNVLLLGVGHTKEDPTVGFPPQDRLVLIEDM